MSISKVEISFGGMLGGGWVRRGSYIFMEGGVRVLSGFRNFYFCFGERKGVYVLDWVLVWVLVGGSGFSFIMV